MADDKKFVMTEDAQAHQGTEMPKITFSTFILSLNAAALVHLGEIDDPATGEKNINLALGKQTIDLISMLADKTRGNLTDEEEKLLKHLLYELRLIFVREKN
jgi:hypothetical protein